MHLQSSPWALAVEHAKSNAAVTEDLTITNPTLVFEELYSPDILQSFLNEQILRYDPVAGGMPSARASIAAHYAKYSPRYHTRTVAPEQVFITASTSESYSHLFALLANAGDEVLVPAPSYPLFETLAQLSLVEIVQYPLEYDGSWCIDLAALEARITEKTRAIVVVTPNNPTGSVLRLHEHEALAECCSRHDLALIVDEVFAEYVFAPKREHVRTTVGDSRCLSFALGGLSKSAALPQMKLGWIVVSGPDELRQQAIARLEHINDAFLSASATVQCAAGALMDASTSVRERINERISANYHALVKMSRDCFRAGVTVLECEGGWMAVLRVARVRAEHEWAEALLAQGVLVQPGYLFDFAREGYLVLSLLTEPTVLARGMQKILALAERWVGEGENQSSEFR